MPFSRRWEGRGLSPLKSRVAHTSRRFEGVKKSRCRGGPCGCPGATTRVAPTTRRQNAIFSHLLFVGRYATQEGYDVGVSKLNQYDGLNHLHYLTTTVPRGGMVRPSIDGFDSERLREQWVTTFAELRQQLSFRIVGYVLMAEHFHALIGPTPEVNPSQIMQKLQHRAAFFILLWNDASVLAMDTVPWRIPAGRIPACIPPSLRRHQVGLAL